MIKKYRRSFSRNLVGTLVLYRAWTRVEVATTLISTSLIRPTMGMGVLTDSNKLLWFISQQGGMYGNIQ